MQHRPTMGRIILGWPSSSLSGDRRQLTYYWIESCKYMKSLNPARIINHPREHVNNYFAPQDMKIRSSFDKIRFRTILRTDYHFYPDNFYHIHSIPVQLEKISMKQWLFCAISSFPR